MTDEESFLAALRANPTDDTTRLVFADWLDENDQPQKASYLRLVAALARAGDDLTDRPEGDALAALSADLPDDWRFVAGGRFVVTLFSYPDKLKTIKCVRESLGNGLGEAKKMTESLPCRIRDGVMFDRARDIARHIRTASSAVIAVLPTELENLPFNVSYEVVASCNIWGTPNGRQRVEGAARAGLAAFLVRAVGMSAAEAATAAAGEPVVLERGLSHAAAYDRARHLNTYQPAYNLSDRWTVGVFARHVATAAE